MEFTPEQKVLNDLFGNDLTYIIPSYQRPYSWSARGKSDKDNQVNTMWKDLIEHFESDNPNIYFMGSMVLIGDATKREFEVVDGQQRLTTLTLLFVSIKCMLQQIKEENIEEANKNDLNSFIEEAISEINLILFNRKKFGLRTQEKKVKIKSLAGFEYDPVLKAALECGHYRDLPTNGITDEQAKVSMRYFDNRDYLIKNLKNQFLDNDVFTLQKAERLDNFVEFLKNKVTVVRILSPRFDVAYQIFEILNNRGLPLSNKDLFRNFIISEMHLHKVSNPEQKWLELDDYEFTPEFIGRYVESTNAKKQKYSAFNDIQEIYKKSFKDVIRKKKVEIFYDDVKDNLKHYTDIEFASYDNKQIKNRILLLKYSGNSRYTVNLLLALFSNISDENNLISFLKEFELFILYLLLGPSKRFQTKPIFSAIEFLNTDNFDNAIKEITLSQTDKADLKQIIEHNNITDNDWAKLMIARYLWAKDMDEPNDVVGFELDYKKSTLEHIIPQNPNDTTNWKKDFSDDFRKDYTYKLGNMTLLTQKNNSRAKNYDFSKKKEIYQKMKLSITTELGNLQKIDEDYIKNRHKSITSYLINHFKL